MFKSFCEHVKLYRIENQKQSFVLYNEWIQLSREEQTKWLT